jgi:serine/threonine protein kinase
VKRKICKGNVNAWRQDCGRTRFGSKRLNPPHTWLILPAIVMIPNGARLGAYQITSLLGQGGMGEEFSRDTDRVSRFQREAEMLGSSNHPNIGAIYNVEEATGPNPGGYKKYKSLDIPKICGHDSRREIYRRDRRRSNPNRKRIRLATPGGPELVYRRPTTRTGEITPTNSGTVA